MNTYRTDVTRGVIVHLEPGEDLYLGIISACQAEGLRDAVIVDGHATLDPVVIHAVTSTGYPIVEDVRTLRGPHELTGLQGLVIEGEMHAHATVADSRGAQGGHLHEGSIVLYLAEVTLLGLRPERPLVRRHEAGTNRWKIQVSGPDE